MTDDCLKLRPFKRRSFMRTGGRYAIRRGPGLPRGVLPRGLVLDNLAVRPEDARRDLDVIYHFAALIAHHLSKSKVNDLVHVCASVAR